MLKLSRLSNVLGVAAVAAMALPAQCPAGGYNPGTGVGGSSSGGAAATPSQPSPGAPATPSPGTPMTPRPGDPAAPGGPTTGGPTVSSPVTPRGGPAAPGAAAAGRSGARGTPMTFIRGATSKSRLTLDWKHPVPPERGSGTSAAGPMPLADALAVLWGDDLRPLLVMRECSYCAGTDLPLLNQSMNNDRTKLLASWFRIVRLPPHVMATNHPFQNVFAAYDFAGPMPHFYLLSHPKAEPISFSGQPTQGYLLASMNRILKERYQLDAKRALKKLVALLDKFDNVDATRKRVKEQLRAARADKGPRSSRARSLQGRLDDLDMDRTKLLAKERKLKNLVLHPFPMAKKAKKAKKTVASK